MSEKRLADTADFDVYVGKRIRRRRMELGLSQEDLGKLMGPISFQAIQKYEAGKNSMSVSRLVLVAKLLDVEPAFFFEGADKTTYKDNTLEKFIAVRGAYDVARSYTAMPVTILPIAKKLFELLASVPVPAAEG